MPVVNVQLDFLTNQQQNLAFQSVVQTKFTTHRQTNVNVHLDFQSFKENVALANQITFTNQQFKIVSLFVK